MIGNLYDPDSMGFSGTEGCDEYFEEYSTSKISGTPVTYDELNINKLITSTNKSKSSNKSNKYIVIHFVGSVSTAYNNAVYFSKTYRGSSAHYFVDEKSIWQVVEDSDIAWHCGAKSYVHKYCRNSNSIGIELCCKKDSSGNWYFENATVAKAIKLTQYLMNKYNVPIDNVIRHYDVTGKNCPEPYVTDMSAWNEFKNRCTNTEEEHWCQKYLDAFTEAGYISDPSWSEFDAPVTKSKAIAFVDKLLGHRGGYEYNTHWIEPYVISLQVQGVIDSPDSWLSDPDTYISKALVLALADKITGGMKEKYVNRNADHWGRNHLDSLCDKAIINTPSNWTDFEGWVTNSDILALMYKCLQYNSNK